MIATRAIRVRGEVAIVHRGRKAFTLIEMSLVLIVIGLIILTIFPALNIMRTSNQRALTQTNLDALMRATAAYVQANGCLPCPSRPDNINSGFGRVRGDGSLNAPACKACPATDGIHLGAVMFYRPDHWAIWIDGERWSPTTTRSHIQIVEVKPSSVRMRWQENSGTTPREILLAPHQTFQTSTGKIIEGWR